MTNLRPVKEAFGLPPDADGATVLKTIQRAKALADRLPALTEQLAEREAEILGEFASAQADGLEPEGARLHATALRALPAEYSQEQYVDALEAAVLSGPASKPKPWKAETNPTPKAGDPKPVPKRKIQVDVLELDPDDGADLDEAELRRHKRALEILNVWNTTGLDPDAYAQAFEEARKEEEVRR